MRGLAFRRHQLNRAKVRAHGYMCWAWVASGRLTARDIGRRATDRVPCSCWMCGNIRRYHGEVTRQELRAVPLD